MGSDQVVRALAQSALQVIANSSSKGPSGSSSSSSSTAGIVSLPNASGISPKVQQLR
jgi:hypothetical protein